MASQTDKFIYQKRWPHKLITASLATSKHILHSKFALSSLFSLVSSYFVGSGSVLVAIFDSLFTSYQALVGKKMLCKKLRHTWLYKDGF